MRPNAQRSALGRVIWPGRRAYKFTIFNFQFSIFNLQLICPPDRANFLISGLGAARSLGCVFNINHNGTCNYRLIFQFHLLDKLIYALGQFFSTINLINHISTALACPFLHKVFSEYL